MSKKPSRPSLADRGPMDLNPLTDIFRGSAPVAPAATESATQQAVETAGQEAAISVSQDTGNSEVPEPVKLMKATFYLEPADIELLEAEKGRRRRESRKNRGNDLSALVREAIRRSYGSGG